MIEFTDRYGGNMPSGLRGCFHCDAMGCNPRQKPGVTADPYAIDEFDQDDWEFVTCEKCHGTARVSWLTTFARVPGWLVKGLRFTFVESPRCTPEVPRYQSWWMGCKAAFLADLGLWKP